MTPLGLTVMRRTATLLHAVPGLRARLTYDGHPLLEVVRPVHPGEAPSGRWLTPCAFRVAVGRAREAVENGKTLAVLGLEAGADPTVELDATRGALLPGGIVHLPTVTGGELAFATTAGAHLVETMAHIDDVAVHCHPDPLTAATLVVHTVNAGAGTDEFAAAVERVQSLLARSAVRELTDDLDAFLHRSELTVRQPNPGRPQAGAQRESRPDHEHGALD